MLPGEIKGVNECDLCAASEDLVISKLKEKNRELLDLLRKIHSMFLAFQDEKIFEYLTYRLELLEEENNDNK